MALQDFDCCSPRQQQMPSAQVQGALLHVGTADASLWPRLLEGGRQPQPVAPAESPLVILIVSQRCSQVTCQHWRLPTSLIKLRVDHKSSSFVSSFLSVGRQFSRGSACQLIKLVYPRLMSLLPLPGQRSFTFGNHEGKHNVNSFSDRRGIF